METFDLGNVSVEPFQFMKSDHNRTCGVDDPHILEIVVLDDVLARSKKVPMPLSSTRATVDTPVKMCIADVSLKESCHDHHFRALVVVLPEAGVFYCHRERRKACVVVPNTHVPVDINWLWVVKNEIFIMCMRLRECQLRVRGYPPTRALKSQIKLTCCCCAHD